MLYLTTYLIIAALLAECFSNILIAGFHHINSKLPIPFKLMLVVLYLTSIVSAETNHERAYQVYEELNEEMPEVVRRTRHLDAQEGYQPPMFNYRTATQQDRMKSRYYRQQQADFNHLKINPINSDKFFEFNKNRGALRNIPFEETGNDWKPFKPNYIFPPKVNSGQENRLTEIQHVVKDNFENDLDIAGSENKEKIEENVEENAEEMVKIDRGDKNAKYIYVQPNILKNNFGLDPKVAQEILKTASPSASSENAEEIQISELKELLGKHPEYQLQGLQKLLEDAKPIMQDHGSVQIEEAGGTGLSSNQPQIEDLQKQLDAVNQKHAEEALAAAQKQAEAHVRAQHQAIALAQKRAEEEAMAKIAAHNEGRAVINPNDHLQILEGVMPVTAAPLVAETPRPRSPLQEAIMHQIEQNSLEAHQSEKVEEVAPAEDIDTRETSALNSRPSEQVLLYQPHRDNRNYAPSYRDLRNNKPIVSKGLAPQPAPQPAPFSKTYASPPVLQPLAAEPEIYAPSEIHNYGEVRPKTSGIEIQHIPVEPKKIHSLAPTLSLQEHRQDFYQEIKGDASHPSENHLYAKRNHDHNDDLHQYAAKYAFGYRILDEKHGNDFGHEEERDGKRTNGHYFVLLPDGRRQKVDYFVDNSGYHAKVSYENVGRHPKFVSSHAQEHLEHRDEQDSSVHS